MGEDPRAVANAILDVAEQGQLYLSNLSLNKILFFAHADHLVLHSAPLVNLTFEAWEFGPVMPIVYRQFKTFGARTISGRAFKICTATGEDVPVDYSKERIDLQFITDTVERYGNLSPRKLVAMSHAPGGPWDAVWNGPQGERLGMTISDGLILRCYLPPNKSSSRSRYVN